MLGLKVRITVFGLLALATSASVLSLFPGTRLPDRRGGHHRTCAGRLHRVRRDQYRDASVRPSFAHRLWLMCERYRSLLAEIQDGMLDDGEILERREALIQQVHAIYEQEFPIDQPAFEGARQLPVESASA